MSASFWEMQVTLAQDQTRRPSKRMDGRAMGGKGKAGPGVNVAPGERCIVGEGLVVHPNLGLLDLQQPEGGEQAAYRSPTSNI